MALSKAKNGLPEDAAAPVDVARAIDPLGAATSFFTLADARLAAFNGGEGGSRRRIAAALALEAAARAPASNLAGFHRLDGKGLSLMVDAGAPATEPFDLPSIQHTACLISCN